MRKTSVLAVLALIAIALSGCATGNGAARSQLETAKLTYADAGIAYEGVMTTLVELRAQHKITDAQWAEIDKAQRVARVVAPQLRATINLWESSGTKPPSYDQLLVQFLSIIQTITAVQTANQHASNSPCCATWVGWVPGVGGMGGFVEVHQ